MTQRLFNNLCCGTAIYAALWVGALAAAEDSSGNSEAERKERLELMKEQAGEYTAVLDSSRPVTLDLHEEPLLRFSNPVGGVPDGIVVMWKEGVRPAIFAQVFQIKSGDWLHECQSIASTGLTMQAGDMVRWRPKASEGEFRPLAGAPVAAGSPVRRLAQLKSLAARFTAADDFKISSTDKETTRHELRLLPTPVYRYDDEAAGIRDGAVFAFVHGTDPEVFLILESRSSADGNDSWHYALAPMTCWGVEARLDGKEVWSTPERLGKSTPSEPYHIWKYVPGNTKAAR